MKILWFFIPFILISSLLSKAQGIQPAPPGKAVVYFVRPSLLGYAINFSYFDSTNMLDKFNGTGYIRYECEPGYHLFWAKAENRDFLEADIDTGKIYFVEAVPQMGAITYGVRLIPVSPGDEKRMTRIIKFLDKKAAVSIIRQDPAIGQQDWPDVITKGMDKYKKDKEKGKTIAKIERDMNYEIK